MKNENAAAVAKLERELRSNFSTEIEKELLKRVKAEAKARGLTIRQVTEHGFKTWLASLS